LGHDSLLGEPLKEHGAQNHHDYRNKENNGEQALLLGFFLGNQRGNKDTACQEGTGGPEQGELEMPGTGDGGKTAASDDTGGADCGS
ncbi:MAG: hypothetical protein SO073_05320, partial [Candidatus Onthomonas sp.]|nr:hypothetical protein [Candidatus Onthomonas sp.]